jgi:hypothetical protein
MDRRLTQIIGSSDLTDRARARERARAILDARDAMSAIRTRSDERTAAEFATAYRQAFGLRPDRSAEDRAYRDSLAARDIGPTEAQALFAQAQARGDELAKTALAEYAWTRKDNPLDGKAWVDAVLQPYGDSNSSYDKAIMTLIGIGNPDRMTQFRDKTATEITQPSDLRGDLRALAAEEGTAESA